MRVFLLILFFSLQVSIVFSAEIVAQFTPLEDSERFAYSVENVRSPRGGGMWNMTLYSVRNNDIDNVSELFVWEDVTWAGIQFTGDFRIAFFFARQRPEASPPARNLYMANGNTGEITKIMSNRDGTGFRVTKDGRFIGFIGGWDSPGYERSSSPHLGRRQRNIFVFDIQNETMERITWSIDWFVDGGWSLFRFDNIFRIYAQQEGGGIRAVAELNPATMELRTLWDMSDPEYVLSPVPTLSFGAGVHCEWQDDVVHQRSNPDIRLQR